MCVCLSDYICRGRRGNQIPGAAAGAVASHSEWVMGTELRSLEKQCSLIHWAPPAMEVNTEIATAHSAVPVVGRQRRETESSRPAWSYIVRPHQSVWHLVGAQKAFVVHHVSSIDSSGLAFLYQLCACPGLSLLQHQVHGSWCCGPCWSSDSPTTQCPRRTCCKWKGSEGGALWDPECSLLLENFDAFSTSNLQGKGLRIQTRTL